MNSGYVDTDMLPGSYPHRKYMICMVWNIILWRWEEVLPMRDKRPNNRPNTEDRATQPMEAGGWVSQLTPLRYRSIWTWPPGCKGRLGWQGFWWHYKPHDSLPYLFAHHHYLPVTWLQGKARMARPLDAARSCSSTSCLYELSVNPHLHRNN